MIKKTCALMLTLFHVDVNGQFTKYEDEECTAGSADFLPGQIPNLGSCK